MLVLIALGLGAAHAIQPGHGKTLVTAVALGPDARFYQPALLGLATTLAHLEQRAPDRRRACGTPVPAGWGRSITG